jgi:hypothetical protein
MHSTSVDEVDVLTVYVVTCLGVTIDEVWIGNWIYCTLIERNYKEL